MVHFPDVGGAGQLIEGGLIGKIDAHHGAFARAGGGGSGGLRVGQQGAQQQGEDEGGCKEGAKKRFHGGPLGI